MDPVIDSVVYVISPDGGSWLSEIAGILAALAATFSALVAIIALRHTRKQISIQNRHNILMITPHLGTTSNISYDSHSFSFTIDNNGIGPAIIKKIKTYVFDRAYEADTCAALDENHFKILQQAKTLYSTGSYIIDEFVPAGNKQLIFSAEGFDRDPEELRNFFFEHVRIVIEYECIYKTKYIYDSDNHKDKLQVAEAAVE